MQTEIRSWEDLGKQELRLGPYSAAVAERLRVWEEAGFARRLWDKDGTLWVPDPEKAAQTPELTDRLGWLTSPMEKQIHVDGLRQLGRDVRKLDHKHIVLLGMGGSSLAPEVLMSTLGNAPGYPPLIVLDTTDPDAIRKVSKSLDLATTFFVVSSKSGGTIETVSLFDFFFEAIKSLKDKPNKSFIIITDHGSPLDEPGEEEDPRTLVYGCTEVGGRYSALTAFGVIPAALIGIDLRKLLDRTEAMMVATGQYVPVRDNPALELGAALGELALAGRDKATFFASPSIATFGTWAEQLIAESLGKQGKGILPVADEAPGPPDVYGDDRVFICLTTEGDPAEDLEKSVAALEEAGHPIIRIRIPGHYDIGAEFYRWEMAVAAAGSVLGINPFDQPDVKAAKKKARKLLDAYEKKSSLQSDKPILVEDDIEVYGGIGGADSISESLTSFLDQANAGEYVAITAYIPRTEEINNTLERFRHALRDRLHLATTLGYGPRFLHSTGQLHKGGPNNGLFIQITHEPEKDLPLPSKKKKSASKKKELTFGVLIAAQALGDYQILAERDRRLIRFHIKGNLTAGLELLNGLLS